MSSRCYAMTHPCRKCRKGTLSLLATYSDHAGINLVTMAPSHSPQRGQEPRWPNPLRSLTFLCPWSALKSLCTVVPDERASSQAGRCTKLHKKAAKRREGTPKEHQRNTKGTPKEHQRNTKEHQRNTKGYGSKLQRFWGRELKLQFVWSRCHRWIPKISNCWVSERWWCLCCSLLQPAAACQSRDA